MTFQALGFSVSHTAPVNVPFASKLSKEHSVRLMNAYVNSIERPGLETGEAGILEAGRRDLTFAALVARVVQTRMWGPCRRTSVSNCALSFHSAFSEVISNGL